MINNEELEKLLISEERHIIVRRGRIATSLMAVPLVLSFSIVDWFFTPEHAKEFFFVRLLVVPVATVAYFLFRFKIIKEKYNGIPAYLMCGFLGIYNSYLVIKTGGELSAYYAGLNLVAMGGVYFMPYLLVQLCLLIGCIFTPYYISIFMMHKNINYSYLITNSAFMFSTAALCLLVNIFNRKLRRSEVMAKVELQKEIQTKEEIIRRKTQEGIYLEKLTAQFSPQVIEEIKSDNINLETKVRKEITCIFIDIVNSTGRSVRLDHHEYTTVISDFFSECIRIFLSYNVTVGTYLGDGIMAFTNAPQANSEHEKTAFDACIEILKFYQTKRKYYSDLWKSDFSVRIGLNSGYAYIGFFPSIKRGTYTAVGEPVNLTSRLCSVAPQNSICVTKKFLLKISDKIENFQIAKIDSHIPIKGFEDDNLDLFSVKAKHDFSLESDFDKCPLCKSIMTVVSTFDNCNLIKCSKCNYTDMQEIGKKAA